MKNVIALSIAFFLTPFAYGDVIVDKGAKATLRVEYAYSNAGKYASPSKDQKREWQIARRIEIVGEYVAETAQPFGALHKEDKKQDSQVAALQATAASSQKKMQPMMSDMMAISSRCETQSIGKDGKQDAAKFEACVQNAVMSYGMNGQNSSAIQSAGAGGAAMGQQVTQQASGKRFQMWKLASQTGTYSINESLTTQIYEMTCTEVKVCKRVETRNGGGSIAPPGKSPAGASFLEVDAQNKDIVITLPVPLTPLGYKQTVVTTVPGESNVVRDTVMTATMYSHASEPMTVAIPSGLASLSGKKTIPLDGKYEEGGVLTITWAFAPHP